MGVLKDAFVYTIDTETEDLIDLFEVQAALLDLKMKCAVNNHQSVYMYYGSFPIFDIRLSKKGYVLPKGHMEIYTHGSITKMNTNPHKDLELLMEKSASFDNYKDAIKYLLKIFQ